MTRRVAVIRVGFLTAKSYVQNGTWVPTLSTSGVARTGWNSAAGCPSRPRMRRVMSKIFASGKVFARSAAVMSADAAGDALALTPALVVAVALAVGDAERSGVVWSGTHALATTTAARRTARRRGIITVDGTRRPAFARRPPALLGGTGAARGGGCPRRSRS